MVELLSAKQCIEFTECIISTLVKRIKPTLIHFAYEHSLLVCMLESSKCNALPVSLSSVYSVVCIKGLVYGELTLNCH